MALAAHSVTCNAVDCIAELVVLSVDATNQTRSCFVRSCTSESSRNRAHMNTWDVDQPYSSVTDKVENPRKITRASHVVTCVMLLGRRCSMELEAALKTYHTASEDVSRAVAVSQIATGKIVCLERSNVCAMSFSLLLP